MNQKRNKNKKKVLGTGLTGMVGSRIVELLRHRYTFKDMSLETGVDIRDVKTVEKKVGTFQPQILLHLAAKTDVDGCEAEKNLEKKSQAWQINVIGTKNLTDAAASVGCKFIYISTDFVFDGKKDYYKEDDRPNPINFYAQTKYEGEKIVQNGSKSNIICRISYPYRSFFPQKADLIRILLAKIKKGDLIRAINDQYIVPTLIDDIAASLAILIDQDLSGIYHAVGSEALTPFDLVQKIGQVFNYQPQLEPISLLDYYRGRAPRPYKTVLKNDKIRMLDARLCSVSDGLKIMRSQLQV